MGPQSICTFTVMFYSYQQHTTTTDEKKRKHPTKPAKVKKKQIGETNEPYHKRIQKKIPRKTVQSTERKKKQNAGLLLAQTTPFLRN